MALYINGRPVNPIVQFLVSAVVLAAVVGIGILLLLAARRSAGKLT